MKKTTILAILSCLLLVGCSKGNNEKPHYYVTIDVEKANTQFKFVKSYTITQNEYSVSSYHSDLITKIDGDTKYKIDITNQKEFDLILTCSDGYDIENANYVFDGTTVNEKILYSAGVKYHVFEMKNLSQKNSNISFTYDVVDAQYNVTIKDFIAPKTDPNNVYNDLVFTATVNGKALTYQSSETIKASDLQAAFASIATNNVIKVNSLNGITLVGKINKDDYFFNDTLNIPTLRSSFDYIVDISADYIDFESEYTLKPTKDCEFYLDFTNLDTKNYKDYTVKSYFGRNMTTKIDYNEILVDGVKTATLTNNVIKNANKVVINYNKEVFDLEDMTPYNGATCEISDFKFPYNDGKKVRSSRVTATKDVLTVTLKDTENNLDPVYWYSGWLDGSTDGRHNLVDKYVCTLSIVIFKVAA